MGFNGFWSMYGISYVVLVFLCVILFPVLNEIAKRKLLNGKKSSAFWWMVQLVEIIVSIAFVAKCPDLGLFLNGWWTYPIHILACIVICTVCNVYVVERIWKQIVINSERKLHIDINGDDVIGKKDVK